MERDKSQKSRSSALNPRTALTKILMLIGKFQAFRIRCIMLILEKLKDYSSSFGSILLPDSGSQIPSTGNE